MEHTIHVASDTPTLVVHGDQLRLEQVVLNLLSNAIRHAPDSKQIDVSLRRMADDAVLEVRDYGPGIAAQDLDMIFEVLTQGRADDQSSSGGLGLGLYISREIAQAHGGVISVRSEPGSGAAFLVRLPIVNRPGVRPGLPARAMSGPGTTSPSDARPGPA
jgi:two-component system CheB/CheR fusion protein